MTVRRLGVAIALIVLIVGGIMDVRRVAAALLVAYLAILSVVLGVLALRMIAFLSTATWFTRFRDLAELVTTTLPLLAVAGVGLIATQPLLRGGAASPPGTAGALYDTPAFMALRFAFYWFVWLTLDARLRAARHVEQTGDAARAAHRYRIVSSAGLILLGVTMTFASLDWMMSLTPGWYSTAYGVYWIAGGLVGGLALLGFLAWRVPNAAVSHDDIHSLAKLLCTFVLFWVYIGFAQYIVIWSANIPGEVVWYVPRTRGAWGALALLILIGGIALPFMLLLLRSVKRRLPLVGVLGALILVFHLLDTAWLLFPTTVAPSWSLAVLSIAAVILLLFFVRLGARVRTHRSPSRLFITR
jgi:hypothetical protein